MKRFAMALALMCALSTPIFAGDMPTGGKSEPPAPPMTASTSSTLLTHVVLTIINLIR